MIQDHFTERPEVKQPTRTLIQTMEEAVYLFEGLHLKADEVKRLADPALDDAAHTADVAARPVAVQPGNDPSAVGSPATDELVKEREEALYELEADLVEAAAAAQDGTWCLDYCIAGDSMASWLLEPGSAP